MASALYNNEIVDVVVVVFVVVVVVVVAVVVVFVVVVVVVAFKIGNSFAGFHFQTIFHPR